MTDNSESKSTSNTQSAGVTRSPANPEELVKNLGGLPPTMTPEQVWKQNQPPKTYPKPPITGSSVS